MDQHVAVCQVCEWEQAMPNRDTAEHVKRVHEDETGHAVVLDA